MEWWQLALLFLGMGLFGFLIATFLVSAFLNNRYEPIVSAATRFVYLINDEERVKRGGTPRYSALDVERALEDLQAVVLAYHDG